MYTQHDLDAARLALVMVEADLRAARDIHPLSPYNTYDDPAYYERKAKQLRSKIREMEHRPNS